MAELSVFSWRCAAGRGTSHSLEKNAKCVFVRCLNCPARWLGCLAYEEHGDRWEHTVVANHRPKVDRRLADRGWRVSAAKPAPGTQTTERLAADRAADSNVEAMEVRPDSRTVLWFSRPLSPRELIGTAGFWAVADFLAAFVMNFLWQCLGWLHTLEEPSQTGLLEDLTAAFSTATSSKDAELPFAVLLAAAAMFVAAWIPIMSAAVKKTDDSASRVEFSVFAGVPILTLVSVVALIAGWSAAGSSAYGKYALGLGSAIVMLASFARSLLWRRSGASKHLRDSQVERLTCTFRSLSPEQVAKVGMLAKTGFLWSPYVFRVSAGFFLPVLGAFVLAPGLWRQQLLSLIIVVLAAYPYLCTVASKRCRATGTRVLLIVTSLAMTLCGTAISVWSIRSNYNLVPAGVLSSQILLVSVAFAPIVLMCFDRYMRDAQVWELAADLRLLRSLQEEVAQEQLPGPNMANVVASSTDVWCKPWWVLAGRLLREVRQHFRSARSQSSSLEMKQLLNGESLPDLRVSHCVKSGLGPNVVNMNPTECSGNGIFGLDIDASKHFSDGSGDQDDAI